MLHIPSPMRPYIVFCLLPRAWSSKCTNRDMTMIGPFSGFAGTVVDCISAGSAAQQMVSCLQFRISDLNSLDTQCIGCIQGVFGSLDSSCQGWCSQSSTSTACVSCENTMVSRLISACDPNISASAVGVIAPLLALLIALFLQS